MSLLVVDYVTSSITLNTSLFSPFSLFSFFSLLSFCKLILLLQNCFYYGCYAVTYYSTKYPSAYILATNPLTEACCSTIFLLISYSP
jgi:hypothetical protein